jgi:predicted aldo/keto reductase-like oxidoreductase
MRAFPEMKKKLGLGMMRLPMNGEEVDWEQTNRMVDAFIAAGFNYFDTAYLYIKEQSQEAVRRCITSRYQRDRFLLANKLSNGYFETREEIRPLIEKQLDLCGVEYFDFFLMHAMGAKSHEKYLEQGAYDIAQEMKAEGKLRHVGFSFHDSPEVLERILTDRPEMEFVQLQFNYVDYEDLHVRSRECYEICRKHGKPVFVMEPVRGGGLVNLPEEALKMMTEYSPAAYALRYCAGFEGIEMILSGMSDMAQIEDNCKVMTEQKPLREEELQMIAKVRTMYQAQFRIPCTGCRYCTDGCPANIDIPEVFRAVKDKEEIPAYNCVACGQCEKICPQHLPIRELLERIQK